MTGSRGGPTTDRDGRFTVRGVGRERIVSLRVSGPGIETGFALAATRDMPTDKVDNTNHGSACDLVAGPGEEGESRFEKGPLPHGTRTDADGRFRLTGLVPGMPHSLDAWRDQMIVGHPAKDVITLTPKGRDENGPTTTSWTGCGTTTNTAPTASGT